MNREYLTRQPLPARHANPFATCWTKPGALEFQFAEGESVEWIVAKLAAANWRGEIIGPHGSGKSTLLESLKPHLIAAGRGVSAVTLRDGQRRLPAGFLRQSLASSCPLIVIDGYEQLSWLSRRVFHARCRRASTGVVITSHRPTGLPLIFRTQADLKLANHLVSMLTTGIPSHITPADVAASHACHGSNLRELFFALYDRHEALSGAKQSTCRTAGCSSS